MFIIIYTIKSLLFTPLHHYYFSPEALFGRKGRPLDAGFYTGSPAYHSLVYQIFEKGAELAASVEVAKEVKELSEATEKETKDESADTSSPNDITELPDKEAELSPTTQPEESEEETLSLSNDVHKTWIKKDAMENVIAEELSDKQVRLQYSLSCRSSL